MIQEKQVYSFEFQNFRRKHANPACGEIFLVEVEISEEEWHYLQSFPRDAIGNCAIQWTERAAQPEAEDKRKPKAVKTPSQFGQFWRELDRTGFHNRPDIRAWTGYSGLDEATAKESLRQALKVEHRSLEASPDFVIEALSTAEGMDSAITVIENLKRRALSVVADEREAA